MRGDEPCKGRSQHLEEKQDLKDKMTILHGVRLIKCKEYRSASRNRDYKDPSRGHKGRRSPRWIEDTWMYFIDEKEQGSTSRSQQTNDLGA